MVQDSASSQYEYPAPAFYFKVTFWGARGSDTSFQEVSGISSEVETEDVVEGGENRYVHRLPKTVKHQHLVLKRGISSADSPLITWCQNTLEKFTVPIKLQTIDVQLLNESGSPLMTWSFYDAYPVKWEVESFNSTKNEVAIEKIEFSYTYSERQK